ncbi:MAG: acetate--CoA ligase family protein [Pseudomonadota bacterium]|nr:acetate--CoA ligase family protein [Pseudomonadota bacterium]
MTDPAAPRPGLSAIFEPRSVAVVGASADPSRIGGRPIAYALRAGFKGRLFPVNPNRDEIQGLKAYPTIEAIPEPIDFVLLAIPAKAVPAALADAAAKGARGAVLFTAGFAEVGEAGAVMQDELVATARKHGIRLLGPNCLGMFNAELGHTPTFTSGLEAGMPLPGRVGLVTQSGAYGTHLLSMARDRRIGVKVWVSTGNEAEVTAPECIEHLVTSDAVDVIGAYMEGVNDREALFRALAAARRARKPVVMMKVGSSAVGAAAAASHTASLAGSDASFDAAMERYGVIRARTTEEMLDVLYAASVSPLPRGRRLAVVTVSGGAGVLMSDAAEEYGLEMPELPRPTQDKILARNPLAAARNPVDLTATVLNDFPIVTEGLQAMGEVGGYDMTAAFFTSWTASPVVGPKLRAAIRAGLPDGVTTPFAMVCQGGPEVNDAYEPDGMMVFEDPSRAIRALAALARLGESFAAAEAEETAPEPLPALPDGFALPRHALSEREAKALIAEAGIPVPAETLAATPEEAAEAAQNLGGPCVLKIVSPDIAHKTEVGGVALDISGGAAMKAAADAMLASVAAKAPGAKIEGLLVGPMISGGVELIVGARRDPVMGPVVLIGLGGVFTEVLRDVAVRLAPVTPSQARMALEGLRGAALLKGARGAAPVDLDAAADAISRLSVIAAANPDGFESLEINPLLARPDGVVALDALLTPLAPEETPA